MFCSGCGNALAPGQAFCAQCGRPSAAVIPPIPGLQFQLQAYAGKIRVLAIFWFIYAGLALLTGFKCNEWLCNVARLTLVAGVRPAELADAECQDLLRDHGRSHS